MKSKSSNFLRRRAPEVGKWVTVYVNGNPHQEHRILVSPYTMRDFENLLSHLTEKLSPPFGAVCRLFTTTGEEVKNLNDIKRDDRYVAAGRSKPPKVFQAKKEPPPARELRSQSAVAKVRGPDTALDSSSDTNVHKKRNSLIRRSTKSTARTSRERERAREYENARSVNVLQWEQPSHEMRRRPFNHPEPESKQNFQENFKQLLDYSQRKHSGYSTSPQSIHVPLGI